MKVEFTGSAVEESRDLNENMVIDLDSTGNLVALTVEHAKDRIDVCSNDLLEWRRRRIHC